VKVEQHEVDLRVRLQPVPGLCQAAAGGKRQAGLAIPQKHGERIPKDGVVFDQQTVGSAIHRRSIQSLQNPIGV
jgi:hypothetical protein